MNGMTKELVHSAYMVGQGRGCGVFQKDRKVCEKQKVFAANGFERFMRKKGLV